MSIVIMEDTIPIKKEIHWRGGGGIIIKFTYNVPFLGQTRLIPCQEMHPTPVQNQNLSL